MDIRLAVPEELDDYERKEALDSALESVTRSVTGLVRRGIVPPAAGMIKSKRVRWHPEPPGAEHFDLPGTVIKRGHGDCDDLAPWHAGSLRAAGIDPGARAFVKKSGPHRWHALVRRSDGSIEDPSLAAGMGHSVSGVGGVGAGAPIQSPMSADGRMCLAICPTRDRRHPIVYFARCDVPDRMQPWDWSSASIHSHPGNALLRAIKKVRAVAGQDIDDEDDARLVALTELIGGADPHDIADALDEYYSGATEDDEGGQLEGGRCGVDVDQVVEDAVQSIGFLGNLTTASVGWDPFRAVSHLVAPVTRSIARVVRPVEHVVAPLLNMVPGAGPIAANALHAMASGDPMKMAQAGLDPTNTNPLWKARELVQKFPQLAPIAHLLAPVAGMALTPFLGPLGPMAGQLASSFVAPTPGAFHASDLLSMLPGGGGGAGLLSSLIPGGGAAGMLSSLIPGGGGGGGFNPMGMLSSLIPGGGGGGGGGFNPMGMLSSLLPQQPGWAPPSFGLDPGALMQSGGGPSFMRF